MTLGLFADLGGLGGLAPGDARADDFLGKPVALVVALALVSLLPFVFMGVTAFVKISTVLQIVRSAIGAQSVPSNTVIMALAGALTLLAMAPVGQKIISRATPLFAGKDTPDTISLVREGIDAVREPMRDFLSANTADREKARFLDVAQRSLVQDARDAEKPTAKDLTVLIPAFVITELTEAFGVGFLLFLPFLVIDLVISNV